MDLRDCVDGGPLVLRHLAKELLELEARGLPIHSKRQ